MKFPESILIQLMPLSTKQDLRAQRDYSALLVQTMRKICPVIDARKKNNSTFLPHRLLVVMVLIFLFGGCKSCTPCSSLKSSSFGRRVHLFARFLLLRGCYLLKPLLNIDCRSVFLCITIASRFVWSGVNIGIVSLILVFNLLLFLLLLLLGTFGL